MFGLFVCLFVLAYFRPGIITTRDIFRMQKIRVCHPRFFSSSDQNLHHDFSFHRSKAAFNFMLWKRRWDHLSCKCTIIILFVCMFVCLFLFVPPQLFWYDFLIFIRAASKFFLVLFCEGIHKQHLLISSGWVIIWENVRQ